MNSPIRPPFDRTTILLHWITVVLILPLLGTILFFVGSGIATSNFITTLLILAALLPVFVRRIAVEERMLTEQLGEEYEAYKAKTWKLIPFVF